MPARDPIRMRMRHAPLIVARLKFRCALLLGAPGSCRVPRSWRELSWELWSYITRGYDAEPGDRAIVTRRVLTRCRVYRLLHRSGGRPGGGSSTRGGPGPGGTVAVTPGPGENTRSAATG